MLEVLTQVIGMCIAGAILYAARELKGISHAVRDLDFRLSRVERWLHGSGIQEPTERFTDDPRPVEKRGGDCSLRGDGT